MHRNCKKSQSSGVSRLAGFILAFNISSSDTPGVKTMRTSRTYPIRFWAIVLTGLLIYQFSSGASAGNCKFTKEIDTTLDLSASEVLAISALAGDLDIVGVPASDKAVISGKACASKQAWLDQSGVSTAGGKLARIEVNLPDVDEGWSFGNGYAWLDLRVEVPQDMTLQVHDSSGDILLKNTAAVNLQDSSGDIEIENALGAVSIRDSSGDIDIDGAEGDITIDVDSSGDIYVNDIKGSVRVVRDSSGDIKISDVRDNVIIERDSSGDISASDVGGDFRVLKDGSGGIRSSNVAGEVDIPRKS